MGISQPLLNLPSTYLHLHNLRPRPGALGPHLGCEGDPRDGVAVLRLLQRRLGGILKCQETCAASRAVERSKGPLENHQKDGVRFQVISVISIYDS